ncbi:MAG: hypothetical protein Tsb0013_15510 [Phycisphaerales bacterium]
MVTTPATSTKKTIGGLLPALLVLLALAVAVGVWMLPDRMVNPSPKTVVARPTAGGASDTEVWVTPEPKRWSVLLASIDQLREPDRQQPVPTGGDEPIDETEGTPVTTPERYTRPPWSYEGYITEPRGMVAVIRTTNGQRLVYMGDEIVFSELRGKSVAWVVTEVSPEKLVISHDGTSYEYPLLTASPSMTPDASRRSTRDTRTPQRAVPSREVGPR